MIVEANGEKFTPLTKGDQYAIAKYILGVGEGTSKPTPVTEETQQDDTTLPPQDKPSEPPRAAVRDALNNPIRTVTMTRGYAYHRANFTAQEAYDKYLEEVKKGSADKQVMDFSTGRQSHDAAFAYWLSETIEVDLPPSVRTV
jgi:hypothetical protein